MDVAVKYDADNLDLIIGDQKLSVFKLIAVRSKAAVLLAFLCLLFPTCHGLGTDILTLYLRNG